MRIVTYHYVRPSPDRPPHGYYHLSLEDFRQQLDYFESEYNLLDRETFLGWVKRERSLPEESVLLTFDDGLIDHYEWVTPELRRRGAFGVFFVPAGPLLDGRVLPVHRVHALAGRHDVTKLRDVLRTVLDERGIAVAEEEWSGDRYADCVTDEALATFKRVLNFEVPYDRLDDVLTDVEARFGGGPSVDEYYLSPDQLRELRDGGMVVGAHTVNHPVLSRLSADAQREEITDSVDALTEIVGPLSTKLFAYPYGFRRSFSTETEAVLADTGFDAAFTTVLDTVSSDRLRAKPFAVPRIDCNEFPYGGATYDFAP